MLFKFGLNLLNLHLKYFKVILKIELLKYNHRKSEFVKSEPFSTTKFSIFSLTGFATVVSCLYTLIIVPLRKAETMFVALLTVGFILCLVVSASLLLYLDDFKCLPNMLLRLDNTFGKHFLGKSSHF